MNGKKYYHGSGMEELTQTPKLSFIRLFKRVKFFSVRKSPEVSKQDLKKILLHLSKQKNSNVSEAVYDLDQTQSLE